MTPWFVSRFLLSVDLAQLCGQVLWHQGLPLLWMGLACWRCLDMFPDWTDSEQRAGCEILYQDDLPSAAPSASASACWIVLEGSKEVCYWAGARHSRLPFSSLLRLIQFFAAVACAKDNVRRAADVSTLRDIHEVQVLRVCRVCVISITICCCSFRVSLGLSRLWIPHAFFTILRRSGVHFPLHGKCPHSPSFMNLNRRISVDSAVSWPKSSRVFVLRISED